MKNESTDKSHDETRFSIDQSSVKTCPFSNPAILVCCSKTCQKVAFICGDYSCKCYKEHNKCPHLSIRSIMNTIQNKIIPCHHFQEQILNKIDKTIDQLSKLKEKLQAQIKQDLSFYGLTMKDKNLLKAINQDKITGKQIIESFHEAIYQENTFAEKDSLENKFSQLWKSIDSEIKSKSSQFFSFLESVQDDIENLKFDLLKDSKIVTTEQGKLNLIKMFEDRIPRSAKLLYRASENNFKADKFHEKCDNIPHTLTLCETAHEKIIGGYTPLSWNKSGKMIKDQSNQSFIFSLTNNHKFKLDKTKDAIYQQAGNGPIFGNGAPDFHLTNSANSRNSCGQINQSYMNQNYTKDDGDSYMKFTGNPDKSYYYTAKEWQVWELEFKK